MASSYLTWTPSATPTGSAKKFTFSAWLKFSSENPGQIMVAGSSSSSYCIFGAYSGGHITLLTYTGYVINFSTSRLFRDLNCWYHVVLACDTTQASATDGVKLYVNGELQTFNLGSVLGESGYTQNTSLRYGTNGELITIGANSLTSQHYFNGSMSYVAFVDGQQLTPATFGSTDATTGEWKINTSPSVTYGNNGFFILKDGNSVTDQSGNGNDFTVGGGTLTKTEDSPSNVFATLNPLAQTLSGITYSNGNTISTMTGDVGQRQSISTLGMPSGKFYMECKLQAVGSTGGSFPYAGIVAQEKYDADMYVGGNGTGWVSSGDIYNGGSNSSTGVSYTTGDIIGLAVDIDNSKLYWHKNGTYILSGNPSTGANGYDISARTAEGTLGFGVSSWNNNGIWQVNFGNGYFGTTAVSSAGTNVSGIGIFEYDVPTGYTALSTKGLNL